MSRARVSLTSDVLRRTLRVRCILITSFLHDIVLACAVCSACAVFALGARATGRVPPSHLSAAPLAFPPPSLQRSSTLTSMHKRTHDTAQGAAASALSSEDLARRLLAAAASTTHLPSPRRRARPAHASGAVGEPCRPLPTSHDLLYDVSQTPSAAPPHAAARLEADAPWTAQICSNLDPQDLYALSNTSKAFRSVVTGPSSASLWVAARERVRLPELELPMTDLQYAHLLFGKGCSFCPRKNAGKADVHFRARICSACIKEQCVAAAHVPCLLRLDRPEADDAFRSPSSSLCSFADPAKPKGKQALAKAVGERRLHPLTIQVATETSREPGPSLSLFRRFFRRSPCHTLQFQPALAGRITSLKSSASRPTSTRASPPSPDAASRPGSAT